MALVFRSSSTTREEVCSCCAGVPPFVDRFLFRGFGGLEGKVFWGGGGGGGGGGGFPGVLLELIFKESAANVGLEGSPDSLFAFAVTANEFDFFGVVYLLEELVFCFFESCYSVHD